MPKMSTQAKMFGMDLHVMTAQLQTLWQQVQQHPWMHRFFPASVLQWRQDNAPVSYAKASGPQFLGFIEGDIPTTAQPRWQAFCLGAENVLQRELDITGMPSTAVRAIVALEAQAMSPFPESQTLWTYRTLAPSQQAGGAQKVELLITSTQLLQQALERAGLNADTQHELWLSGVHGPALLSGYAETKRLRNEQRWYWGAAAAVTLVGLLLLAAVLTPSAQLRMRALDATRQYDAIHTQTQTQQAQRQELLAGMEELSALKKQQQMRIHHAVVLHQLTSILSDETALDSISFEGNKLRLRGLSENAANVAQVMAATPGFKEVRIPSAVTRIPLMGKENFVIEAELDPDILGAWKKAVASTSTSSEPAPHANAPSQNAGEHS